MADGGHKDEYTYPDPEKDDLELRDLLSLIDLP